MSTNFPTTLEDWLIQTLSYEDLVNICHHGEVNSFDGLTYYSDIAELYDVYHQDIWAMLTEEFKLFGQSSCLSYVASFPEAAHVESEEDWKNLLLSFAIRNLAYRLTEGRSYQ